MTNQIAFAHKIIKISNMYSPYHQKQMLTEIYKTMKRRRKDSKRIFENWMTIHNLNY